MVFAVEAIDQQYLVRILQLKDEIDISRQFYLCSLILRCPYYYTLTLEVVEVGAPADPLTGITECIGCCSLTDIPRPGLDEAGFDGTPSLSLVFATIALGVGLTLKTNFSLITFPYLVALISLHPDWTKIGLLPFY